MSKSRLEWKVGLFVIICLGLLAALLIQFSKGASLFKPTKRILLRASNGSGLKPRAAVLMAGVQIGTVGGIKLGPQGTNVTITLTIYNEFRIPTNSDFSIEASGVLGDQYVSITPRPTTNAVIVYYKDGDVATANAPWTLLGVANRVLTSLGNFDEAAGSLRQTIDAVHQGALSQETLSNFSVTISNLRQASGQAVVTLSNLDALILTNGPAISRAGASLDNALSHVDQVALDARMLIESNRPAIDETISNLVSATHRLDMLMADVEKGQGVAGKLLKDEKMAEKLSGIVSDLSVTSSNLNRFGLWRLLFPKRTSSSNPPRNSTSGDALRSPKDSFR